jgi:hypothetical protein
MNDHVVVLLPIVILVRYQLGVVRNDAEHDQLSADVIHLILLIKKMGKFRVRKNRTNEESVRLTRLLS